MFSETTGFEMPNISAEMHNLTVNPMQQNNEKLKCLGVTSKGWWGRRDYLHLWYRGGPINTTTYTPAFQVPK